MPTKYLPKLTFQNKFMQLREELLWKNGVNKPTLYLLNCEGTIGKHLGKNFLCFNLPFKVNIFELSGEIVPTRTIGKN